MPEPPMSPISHPPPRPINPSQIPSSDPVSEPKKDILDSGESKPLATLLAPVDVAVTIAISSSPPAMASLDKGLPVPPKSLHHTRTCVSPPPMPQTMLQASVGSAVPCTLKANNNEAPLKRNQREVPVAVVKDTPILPVSLKPSSPIKTPEEMPKAVDVIPPPPASDIIASTMVPEEDKPGQPEVIIQSLIPLSPSGSNPTKNKEVRRTSDINVL